MCLITFQIQRGNQYPFVLIANRDEAYLRESLPIHFWEDHPNIIGGRDMKAGGTWLALTKEGRFAALTNQPFTQHEPQELNSRGSVITDFLTTEVSVIEYVKKLREDRLRYDGYQLLFGTIDDLYVYNNVEDEFKQLTEGIHSVSNTKDDLSHYRQAKSEANLAEMLKESEKLDLDTLIESFQDLTPNPNFSDYPEQLDREFAKQSSSIFIRNNQDFGTVSTTAIVMDEKGQLSMKEVRYNPEEVIQVTEDYFIIE